MPNYRENSVTGASWRRANSVQIVNPINDVSKSTISFNEEDVFDIGGELLRKEVGQLVKQFGTGGTFDLLNPIDNTVVGSMTYTQLYVALYSLYMQCAAERDAT